MSPGAPAIRSALRTEPGIRDTNEDAALSVALPDGRWLAAVADGMGGLEAGERASRIALDVLKGRLAAGSSLVRAVEDANRAVFNGGDGRPSGTTLVAALVDGRSLRIANVGDSRAYLVGPAGLVQVTRDHTYGAEAAAQGGLAAGDVASSRWGRTLTRSLGASETVEVDEFGPMTLDDDMKVLLCSDGVHGVLDDHAIQACLQNGGSLQTAAERLLARSLEEGGTDNLSAVVFQRGAAVAARPTEGTDPAGSGVSEREESKGEPSSTGIRLAPPEPGDPEIRLELPGRPESPEPPGILLTAPAPEASSREGGTWNPRRLASRSHRRRRRKPGRLRTALLVLALAGAAVLILALLP